MKEKNKLVLIDGHSILNRAFYGVPELTNSSGIHTNAIYGFLNILFKIIDEEQPTHLAVAFDVKQPTFRHKMFAEYKGTRKPMLEELREQVPVMQQVLAAMDIKTVTLPGYEADDVLGTMSKRAEAEGMIVSVITGDRDLLQLASKNIMIRIPKTKKGVTEVENYHEEDVKEKYQVTPEEFIDVKALMGDTADNIPGVPSVGEKTATSLIVEYHSIENIYNHIEDITKKRLKEVLIENKDQAYMSKELATINIDSPVEVQFEETKVNNIFTDEAYEFMKKLEFKSIINKFNMQGDNASHIAETIDIDYKYVNDFNEADQIFSKALKCKTIGVNIIEDDKNKDAKEIAAFAIALSEKEVYVIKKEWFITNDYLSDKFKELILSEKVFVTLIDLKRHLKFLSEDGFDSYTVFDNEIAAYLLNPLKDTYNYDDLARDYMGVTVLSRTELLGKLKNTEAMEKDEDHFLTYAAFSAYIVLASYNKLKEELIKTEQYKLFCDIEMPLIYSLNRMENAGVKVEKNELEEYSKLLSEKINILENEIYKDVDTEFNINSPKQLGQILFEKMQLPGGKKTKTGYSTSADVLEKLAPEYPFIQKILDYRQLTKLKSTYADGLTNYIKEDGRIHGTFNQTITATGRISSTEPNLQNIPIRMEMGKAIRKVFVPKEGYKFIDADYSQIELRVLADISDDENLIEAYKSDQDIHRITASKVFNTPLEEVTQLQRRNAKAVNFGIVYGISSFGLSQDLSISRKEASEYIQQYFKTYPKIKLFLDRVVEEAKDKGYVTTMFGRRRPIPELKSSNFMQRSFGERIAMNSPIQGSAADIIKKAMIDVDKALRENNMDSKIVLQVHDELLIEVKDSEMQKVKDILENKMRNAVELKVNLEIDIETGDNWLDAH